MSDFLEVLVDVGESLLEAAFEYKKTGKQKLNGIKESSSYEYKPDNGEDKKEDNSSENSFKGEFNDYVEDSTTEIYIHDEKQQVLINGFNLRDAMIAKEIFDKPICKKRRTRGYRGGR